MVCHAIRTNQAFLYGVLSAGIVLWICPVGQKIGICRVGILGGVFENWIIEVNRNIYLDRIVT
jgi:hypothetical protein